MGFFIGFVEDKDVVLQSGESSQCGAILIGSIEETFVVPLSYWKASDYERHWEDALVRLVYGRTSSCLITSMYDPKLANFIVWWPMYLVNQTVFVQNQILFFDRLETGFDEQNPFQNISERQTINADGLAISEWSIELTEVRRFVERGGKERGGEEKL